MVRVVFSYGPSCPRAELSGTDIYFEIVGPTAFLSVRTDGPTVFGKSDRIGVGHHRVVYQQYLFHEDSLESDR